MAKKVRGDVDKIVQNLSNLISEELVDSVRARYGAIGDNLLTFAVALEVGLPALSTIQNASAAAHRKAVQDLKNIIERQNEEAVSVAEQSLQQFALNRSTRGEISFIEGHDTLNEEVSAEFAKKYGTP
jgi:hypothetical protein